MAADEIDEDASPATDPSPDASSDPVAPRKRKGKTWLHQRLAREERRSKLKPKADEKPRILTLACMKNEGAGILEWVAYHRAIGVDHFLIFTNDCEDGSDLIWQRLAQLGLATHRDNTARSAKAALIKPQTRALVRAIAEPVYEQAEWVLVIDADEFLNIHAGDGSVDAMIAQNPAADCFFINWRLFGTSGVQDFSEGLLIEQFSQGADPARVNRHHALAPKAMFRPLKFPKAGIHRPAKPADDAVVKYVGDDGSPCTRRWAELVLREPYKGAQINHYSVQSLDMLLLKFARGFAVAAQMESPRDYLQARDFNHLTDVSIQRHLPAVRAELARLMEDPLLARLHRNAVNWRLTKIREALEKLELRAVKDDLIAAQAAQSDALVTAAQ